MTLPESLLKPSRRSDGKLNLAFWIVTGVVGLLLLCAILIGAFEIYQYTVNEPKAQKTQVELENEYRAIQQLPNAVTRRPLNASHKTNQALVGTDYLTNLKYPEIRAYYDAELSEHGWRFLREEKVTEWGKDYGGKKAIYCKGDYVTSIQYAGDSPNHAWVYALNMSWNLTECK